MAKRGRPVGSTKAMKRVRINITLKPEEAACFKALGASRWLQKVLEAFKEKGPPANVPEDR